MALFLFLNSDLYLGENFGPVIVLYIGFGLGKMYFMNDTDLTFQISGIIPFTYILSFCFTNPFTARIVTLIIAYVGGPLLPINSFFLHLAGIYFIDIILL